MHTRSVRFGLNDVNVNAMFVSLSDYVGGMWRAPAENSICRLLTRLREIMHRQLNCEASDQTAGLGLSLTISVRSFLFINECRKDRLNARVCSICLSNNPPTLPSVHLCD